MSEFEFAPTRKEYDYFNPPRTEKPSKSLSVYEALSSRPAPGEITEPFEFYKSPERDFFGHVIETKPESKASTERFEFAPTRKEAGYFDGPDEATKHEGNFTKGHDHDDCDCAGECRDCSAKVEKMTFRKGQKLRHVRTGKIYEMVKTLCIGAKGCRCLLKADGSERECLFYPGEVEAA